VNVSGDGNPKGCFLRGMGRSNLVVFQGKKVGFYFILQGITLLVVWDGCLKKMNRYVFYF
jgi:hypothetical protein